MLDIKAGHTRRDGQRLEQTGGTHERREFPVSRDHEAHRLQSKTVRNRRALRLGIAEFYRNTTYLAHLFYHVGRRDHIDIEECLEFRAFCHGIECERARSHRMRICDCYHLRLPRIRHTPTFVYTDCPCKIPHEGPCDKRKGDKEDGGRCAVK